MAATPIKTKKPSDLNTLTKSSSSPSSISLLSPQTPISQTPTRRLSSRLISVSTPTSPRRSSRRLSLDSNDPIASSPEKSTPQSTRKTLEKPRKTPKSNKKPNLSSTQIEKSSTHEPFIPASPDLTERKKRKREKKPENVPKSRAQSRAQKGRNAPKKRVYYKKAIYDGGEFSVGDDVYVRRREDASSDEEEPEVEECRVCFRAGKAVMIECDDCLGGFHLKCLKPPLKEVPEGDWVCGFCEAKKLGKEVKLPEPPKGKKRVRTLREKLLSSDLWAARIERYNC